MKPSTILFINAFIVGMVPILTYLGHIEKGGIALLLGLSTGSLLALAQILKKDGQ